MKKIVSCILIIMLVAGSSWQCSFDELSNSKSQNDSVDIFSMWDNVVNAASSDADSGDNQSASGDISASGDSSSDAAASSDASADASSDVSSDASANASSDSTSGDSTDNNTVKVKAGKVKALYFTSRSSTSVRLKWETKGKISFYKVYRRLVGKTYKLITTTTKKSYIDTTVKANKNYQYKIVPYYKKNGKKYKGTVCKAKFSNKSTIVSTDHQKYSYEEMKGDLSELEAKYHGIITVNTIGKTIDKRNIYDVIIGDPDADKCMLVVSTLHAREYMTSLLCMNQIEYYLQNYYGKINGKSVKKTLESVCVHYVVMANPDGVTISQFGFNAIRNTTVRAKLKKMWGSATVWKSNANGVDLNRNYNYIFKLRGVRGQEGYSGPKGNSELETQAISKLTRSLKNKHGLKGVFNYHAMGNIIFGSTTAGHSTTTVTKQMYSTAIKTTGYVSNSAVGYQASGYGNYREYVMYCLKIPSITVEIGSSGCPVPQWQYSSVWYRNKNLILYEARLFE